MFLYNLLWSAIVYREVKGWTAWILKGHLYIRFCQWHMLEVWSYKYILKFLMHYIIPPEAPGYYMS